MEVKGIVINEIKGNLFDDKTNCLAHCVSEDLKMGAGIALQFRKIFGVSKLQKKDVGDVSVLEEGSRFIYYLITKRYYYQKPTYQTLKLSLIKMREHMIENKINRISMPKIGCGLDKLRWKDVLCIIKEVFEKMNIKIDIYYL